MSRIVKSNAYHMFDSVHVALNEAGTRIGASDDCIEGVMKGIEAGILAVENPEFNPGEILEDISPGEALPGVEYQRMISADYYKRLFIGALAAPYILHASGVMEDREGK